MNGRKLLFLLPDWVQCRYAGVFLRVGMTILLLVTVWFPHYKHFYIDRSPVDASILVPSQNTPSAAVLNEIAAMHFAINLGIPAEKVLEAAEEMLGGVVNLPALFAAPVRLRGYPDDFRVGSLSTQLVIASLSLERLLLDAFDRTGEQRFLHLALRRVLDFSAYEISQYQAGDFLWNDHALAARISVLAHLWRVSRNSPSVSTRERLDILSLVQRSGRLLASPAQFTVRTNHGVMQNLALLQLSAAFPFMPEATEWRNLGLKRLRLQAAFYVSPEGFVLEHSGEYHAFGAELLAQAMRLCVLNEISPPSWLVHNASITANQLEKLIRPDGSLPLIGNTSAGSRFLIPDTQDKGSSPLRNLAPKHQPDTQEFTLLPVAGYAIWWSQNTSGLLSQVVSNWSKHDGHGHKHADEGAVQLWANGVDWITSTGYWPYGVESSNDAYGWRSSNALHGINENSTDQRSTDLLGFVAGSTIRALDLNRSREIGGVYRRQLVQLDADTLLVVDFSSGSDNGTETIWTVSPELELKKTDLPSLFTASVPGQERRMWISLVTPIESKVELVKGSSFPFAGWVVSQYVPTPSWSLRVTVPHPESFSATLFSLGSKNQSDGSKIYLKQGAAPENWHITIIEGQTSRQVTRVANTLSVVESGIITNSFSWTVPSDISVEQFSLKAAYEVAIKNYPPWRDLSVYRRKLSYLIAAVTLLFELALIIVSRSGLFNQRKLLIVNTTIVLFWVATGIWAQGIYLK